MGYVYLPPLFDENKCSYRFGYCLKKHLNSIGIKLERFSLLKNVDKLPCDISLYIGDINSSANARQIEKLCSLLKENNKEYGLKKIDVVQFWRRIGIGDYSKTAEKIGQWCNE